jgi:hypothetical protein
MSRTAELQHLIQQKITSLVYTAYADEAPDGAAFPYVVYNIDSFAFEDARDDITLVIDIWDEYPNYSRVELMADNIEEEFTGNAVHDDSATILPQFFRYIRTKVPDPNKKLKRVQLKVQIQNYAHTPHPLPTEDDEQ